MRRQASSSDSLRAYGILAYRLAIASGHSRNAKRWQRRTWPSLPPWWRPATWTVMKRYSPRWKRWSHRPECGDPKTSSAVSWPSSKTATTVTATPSMPSSPISRALPVVSATCRSSSGSRCAALAPVWLQRTSPTFWVKASRNSCVMAKSSSVRCASRYTSWQDALMTESSLIIKRNSPRCGACRTEIGWQWNNSCRFTTGGCRRSVNSMNCSSRFLSIVWPTPRRPTFGWSMMTLKSAIAAFALDTTKFFRTSRATCYASLYWLAMTR